MHTHIDLRRYRARRRDFSLARYDPAYLPASASKEDARAALAAGTARMRQLQDKLYAQDRWAVLIILQAMDAAGKDSTIEHVMSGVNPQSCEVHSFKAPSEEELDHDFLWRTTVRLPRRGHLGIFNRSYYEEVLVARVHPELLDRQRLPSRLVTRRIWAQRYDDIVAHERHLARSGTVVRKIFLHLSREEQRRRFLRRLDEPDKRWKFSAGDVAERARWQQYQRAYEQAIAATTTDDAPWFVVPADRKWFAREVVSAIIIDAMEGLDLEYPRITGEKRRELLRIRRTLQRSR